MLFLARRALEPVIAFGRAGPPVHRVSVRGGPDARLGEQAVLPSGVVLLVVERVRTSHAGR